VSDPAPVTLKGLANRLKMPRAMVRKIALHDLIQRDQQQRDEQIAVILREHLAREEDAALRQRIEEHLRKRGG
jgi:hypothetical protein